MQSSEYTYQSVSQLFLPLLPSGFDSTKVVSPAQIRAPSASIPSPFSSQIPFLSLRGLELALGLYLMHTPIGWLVSELLALSMSPQTPNAFKYAYLKKGYWQQWRRRKTRITMRKNRPRQSSWIKEAWTSKKVMSGQHKRTDWSNSVRTDSQS